MTSYNLFALINARTYNSSTGDLIAHLPQGLICVKLKRTCRNVSFQLLGTPSPVLLYCLPARGGGGGAGGGGGGPLPALHAALELQQAPTKRYNAYFFRHLVVALRPLAIRLEERYDTIFRGHVIVLQRLKHGSTVIGNFDVGISHISGCNVLGCFNYSCQHILLGSLCLACLE